MSNSNFYHLYKEKGQILGISHNPCQPLFYRIIAVFVFWLSTPIQQTAPPPNLVIKNINHFTCL